MLLGCNNSQTFLLKKFFFNILPDQLRPRLHPRSAGGTDSPRPGFTLHNTSYGQRHTVYNIAFSEAWSRVQASPPAQSDVFPAGLLACFCCVISLVLVSSFPGCFPQSHGPRFESPFRPKQDFAGRIEFFYPALASCCHQSKVQIPVPPQQDFAGCTELFSLLLDDIFGQPGFEPPSPRAICPRSSQL